MFGLKLGNVLELLTIILLLFKFNGCLWVYFKQLLFCSGRRKVFTQGGFDKFYIYKFFENYYQRKALVLNDAFWNEAKNSLKS